MLIDEAIANEKEMAEGLREQYECMMECSDIFREQKKVFIEQCKHDAEYHEQITEWLEELKSIKDGSIPIIHGKAELELHDKVIRKETIGDMVGNLIANSRTEIIDGKLMLIVTEERIKTVANEMKRQLDS